MKRQHLPIAHAFTISCLTFANSMLIKTHEGDIRGFTQNSIYPEGNVTIFYGIPFAKPPVGELRFKKPQPPTPWDGALEATRKPNSCQQEKRTFVDFELARALEVTTNLSEDCLYLNVWTPATVANNSQLSGERDVIFWIHGGGFQTGSSTLDASDGSYLALMKNVVFVSVNYRLGPFGFLFMGTEDVPGNMALYDTVMALDWVKYNIGAFGGNPESVTIMGVSAGAALVSALVLSPVSKGKFKNAVMESGTMFAPWSHKSKQEALKVAKSFSEAVGCSKVDSTSTCSTWDSKPHITDCLRKIEAKAVLDAMKLIHVQHGFDMIMPPTIDGHFFPDSPIEMLKIKNVNSANTLIGHTSKEGSMFMLPSPIFNNDVNLASSQFVRSAMYNMTSKLTKSQLDLLQVVYADWTVTDTITRNRDSLVDFIGDYFFVCSSISFASALSAANSVHYYEFHHLSNLNGKLPKWVGAFHGADMLFFLGAVYNKRLGYNKADRNLSEEMMKILTRFASRGNPSQSETTWPEFQAQEPHVHIFGNNSTPILESRVRGCAYFNEIFPNWAQYSNHSTTEKEKTHYELPSSNTIAHFPRMDTILFSFLFLIIVISSY